MAGFSIVKAPDLKADPNPKPIKPEVEAEPPPLTLANYQGEDKLSALLPEDALPENKPGWGKYLDSILLNDTLAGSAIDRYKQGENYQGLENYTDRNGAVGVREWTAANQQDFYYVHQDESFTDAQKKLLDNAKNPARYRKLKQSYERRRRADESLKDSNGVGRFATALVLDIGTTLPLAPIGGLAAGGAARVGTGIAKVARMETQLKNIAAATSNTKLAQGLESGLTQFTSKLGVTNKGFLAFSAESVADTILDVELRDSTGQVNGNKAAEYALGLGTGALIAGGAIGARKLLRGLGDKAKVANAAKAVDTQEDVIRAETLRRAAIKQRIRAVTKRSTQETADKGSRADIGPSQRTLDKLRQQLDEAERNIDTSFKALPGLQKTAGISPEPQAPVPARPIKSGISETLATQHDADAKISGRRVIDRGYKNPPRPSNALSATQFDRRLKIRLKERIERKYNELFGERVSGTANTYQRGPDKKILYVDGAPNKKQWKKEYANQPYSVQISDLRSVIMGRVESAINKVSRIASANGTDINSSGHAVHSFNNFKNYLDEASVMDEEFRAFDMHGESTHMLMVLEEQLRPNNRKRVNSDRFAKFLASDDADAILKEHARLAQLAAQTVGREKLGHMLDMQIQLSRMAEMASDGACG